MWKQALRALVLASLPSLAMAAPPVATATIVEGEAVLIREAAAYGLVEGLRLQKDDIVQSGAKGKFIRLEFADGVVVDLAGDSRIMLSPKTGPGRDKMPPRLYLLRGSMKVAVPSNLPEQSTLLASPNLDVPAVTQRMVVSVTPQETSVFAESGSVSLVERHGFKPRPAQSLRSGQFYVQAGDAKAQVTTRPSAAFIQSLPKAFLDTLPSRLELFKGRDVAPRRAAAGMAYADVQPWIDAEPALRPQFVRRWRSLVKNPEFRAGLVAGIAVHPEWDRLLFPEKYRPKPRPGDTPPVGQRP